MVLINIRLQAFVLQDQNTLKKAKRESDDSQGQPPQKHDSEAGKIQYISEN